MAALLIFGIAYNSRSLIASQTEENKTDTTTAQTGQDLTAQGVTVQEDTTAETPAATSGTSTDTNAATDTSNAAATTAVNSLSYENDQVIVTVSAATEGIIPAGATLKVVPIKADAEETKDQYAQVAQKVQENAASTDSEVAGFLAYDITFVDAAGHEVEPNGEVNVSMDYKEAALPDGVSTDIAESSDVTVLHLEEDNTGTVQNVVDLKDESKITELQTTDEQKVEKTSFKTDSFSTYTITWKTDSSSKVIFHYGYYNSNGTWQDITNVTTTTINYAENNGQYIPLVIKHISGYQYSSNYIAYTRNNSQKTVNNIGALYYGDGLYYFNTDMTQYGGIGRRTCDVYIVYNTDSSQTEEEKVESLANPGMSKYIKDNGDGDYTLTLDVTGTKSVSSGADVLLVLDCSGSMGPGYNNLMTTMKTQVNKLADKVLSTNKLNNVAVVSFSSGNYAGNNNSSIDWTKDYSSFSSKVNGLNYNGGTNWQEAMIRAETMLNADTSTNKKYVIFISDGEPTIRYQSYSAISGSTGNELGDGNNDDDDRNFNAAVGQFELSAKLRNTEMYAMYLTSDTQVAMTKFATAIGATAANGIGSNFDTTMTEIANHIAYNAYKNVSISDTLSDYVDLSANPQWTVQKDGVIMESSSYTLTTDGKSFTLTINGELEKDATYSVSCHITPSTLAYYKYETDGYTNTGEDGTDADGNYSSSGELGFYSDNYTGTGSKEGRAVLKYDEKVGTSNNYVTYKHPVVQVDCETVSHSVSKTWFGESLASLNATLIPEISDSSSTSGYRELTAPEINDYYAFSSITWQQTLANNKDGQPTTATWNDLPKYYYYLDSNNAIQRTEIRYTVKENFNSTDESNLYDSSTVNSTDNTSTAITNTRKSFIDVVKTWVGNDSHTSDTVYVGLYNNNVAVAGQYIELNSSNEWKGSFGFVGTLSDYSVKELKVAANGENADFTINNVGYIGLSANDVNTISSKTYDVTYSSASNGTYSRTDTITNTPLLNRLVIMKQDASDSTKKLQGAVFKLQDQDGNDLKDANNNVLTVTTDKDGKATIDNLKPGTYLLVETTAPTGYTLLSSPVTVVVKAEGTIYQDSTTKVHYYETDQTISNNKIYVLPKSGGMGTYLFTISGVAILMTALLLFITNKRKGARVIN